MKSLYMLVFLSILVPTPLLAQAKGALKGNVLDEQGNVLHGAVVRLEPDRHVTQTGSKGEFDFEEVFAGQYSIIVTMIGYHSHSSKVIIEDGEISSVKIHMQPANSKLSEVVVSARQETTPDNLIDIQRSAMPVTIISRKTIELMGSRRLDEVLKEQTGIAIVNNIAGGSRSVGVQMQGFGSEYVMILIDGQPMMGRNSGNFDLSRISVSNIERIEIIKGASSCLFGSDALGGAINIITRHGALQPQALASLNYGDLNILDATLEGETPFASQRGSVNISGNYYQTDGFNTNARYIQNGTTAPPYDNYSLQGRARYRISRSSTVGISGRYGLRRSYMEKDFGLGAVSGDSQDEKDLNLSVNLDHNFSSALRSMSRYYFTRYSTDQSVTWQQSSSVASMDVFTQALHRVEQQFAYTASSSLRFTGGIGGSVERMNDQSLTNPGTLSSVFAFAQGDWQVNERLGLVSGLRYDLTNAYGSKLNPSLGMQYRITGSLTIKAGVGSGFKAPDYKTQYLIFYNPVANYLVIGSEVLHQTLGDLEREGQISEVRRYVLDQLAGRLRAEKSTSLNAGFLWQPAGKMKVETGVFHHRLRNQINSIQVATGTGNRNIFTYQNLPEALNKGIDISVSGSLLKDLELSAGYQYLRAQDLSVTDSIKAGNWPYNQNIHDPVTGKSHSPSASDYWGIENRSRHMLNIKAFYSYSPWNTTANLRINYRSRYPFGDRNGNQFIDRYDTFVSGYFLINAGLEKRLWKDHANLRLTADNIMNYTDPLIPGQPGRVILAGITYRFFKR